MYHTSILIYYVPFIMNTMASWSPPTPLFAWQSWWSSTDSSYLRSSSTNTNTIRNTDSSRKSATKKDRNTKIEPWLFGRSTTLPVPVVGILAQPYGPTNGTNQYIAASYVKYIEMGGGRSIPIPYDTTNNAVLDDIYRQIHGLLLPGGANSTIPYAVQYLLDKVMERNAQGYYFPVWGTCLGFEMILEYVGSGRSSSSTSMSSYSSSLSSSSSSSSILQDNFNASNISLPLILLTEKKDDQESDHDDQYKAVRGRRGDSRNGLSFSFINLDIQKSALYAPPNIHESVTKHAITMNNHHQGIEPEHFQQNPYLTQYFEITSINYDLNFRPFVSTIEPKHPYQFPIYGVQYHPEKNAFEYATYPNTTIPFEAIDHSPQGIELSFYLAEFFMNCVRFGQYTDDSRNQDDDQHQHHEYTDAVKFPAIITYPLVPGLSFEEVYLLPNASHWEKDVRN